MGIQVEITREELNRQCELMKLRDEWSDAMANFQNGYAGCVIDRGAGGIPYLRFDIRNTGPCPVRQEISKIAARKFAELHREVLNVIDNALPMKIRE